MKNAISKRKDAGFSLIELLIVLVILGIIVTFALIALGSSTRVIERQAVAKEFKVALERARFDSVKRRPATCEEMARVEVTSTTSFRYITDSNQDGTLQPDSEARVVNFGSYSEVGIVDGATPPFVIRFDMRGNTSSGACGSETAAATPTHFCELPCTTRDSSNSSSVYVSPTGTVALLNGGDTIGTFTPPTVSNVSTADINEHLAVWTGTPPTPTPMGSPSGTPSETPSESPTPTPTPDPSGSPTPTPTPTPTPAPLPACTFNQRPGNPRTCDCQSPWSVQRNGKCQ